MTAILAVICLGLYGLGAVLAYEIAQDVEGFDKRIAVVLFWPSVAVFLLMDRSETK